MKFEKIDDNRLKITLKCHELLGENNLDYFMEDPDAAKRKMIKILDDAHDEVGFDSKNYKLQIEAKQLSDDTLIFIVNKVLKLKTTKNDENSKELKDEKENEINGKEKTLKNNLNQEDSLKNTNNVKGGKKAKSSKTKQAVKPKPILRDSDGFTVDGSNIKVRPLKIPKLRAHVVMYKFSSLEDYIQFCKQLKLQQLKTFKSLCKYSELYEVDGKYYLAVININEEHKKIGIFYTNITEFSEFYSTNIIKYYALREKNEPLLKMDALRIGQML